MRISELSNKTGVSMRSLRYYEEKGLIEPKRLHNGYRDYDESILEQVKTIRLYFNLGLSIAEIQEVVNCDPFVFPYQTFICDDVMALYQNKLIEVEQQLKTLTEIQSRLKSRIQKIEELRETMNRSEVNDESKP